ncbi:MAG: GNAT family N-acetyltransferase [Micropepsaceae bacterium]
MTASQCPTKIHLTTPRYDVRTIEPDDVTLRWAAWMADPAKVKHLNTKPLALSLEDIRRYVAGFDHVKSHILGIFEKGSGTMIGFWEVYIDWTHREVLINVLVGEDRGRHEGITTRRETQRALLPYFFQTLGLEAMRCAVVSTNEPIRHIFDSRGLVHEHASSKAAADGGAPVEILHFRLTKDEWTAMRAARLERDRLAAKAAG